MKVYHAVHPYCVAGIAFVWAVCFVRVWVLCMAPDGGGVVLEVRKTHESSRPGRGATTRKAVAGGHTQVIGRAA